MTFFRSVYQINSEYRIMIRRPTAPAHEESYHAHHETQVITSEHMTSNVLASSRNNSSHSNYELYISSASHTQCFIK